MSSADADTIRTRLVEIDDELRLLRSDAFARKHELLTETDSLRKTLSDLEGPEADLLRGEWAERAGRKGAHTADPEQLKGAIVSPSEGGSSS